MVIQNVSARGRNTRFAECKENRHRIGQRGSGGVEGSLARVERTNRMLSAKRAKLRPVSAMARRRATPWSPVARTRPSAHGENLRHCHFLRAKQLASCGELQDCNDCDLRILGNCTRVNFPADAKSSMNEHCNSQPLAIWRVCQSAA